MRVTVNKTEGVISKKVVHCILKELTQAKMPQTRDNKEYVAVIEGETINIFWATRGASCRCSMGSVLAQDAKGSRKLGFVDIFAENIIWSIWNLIYNYWQKEYINANDNYELVQKNKIGSVHQFQPVLHTCQYNLYNDFNKTINL